ncbi:MAG: hypothetical protein OCU22_03365 [Canidatus Methanoxibalbensis ujae]|nr:hypothetical protein [Candidatus Methanoxibalbensis ujae]
MDTVLLTVVMLFKMRTSGCITTMHHNSAAQERITTAHHKTLHESMREGRHDGWDGWDGWVWEMVRA